MIVHRCLRCGHPDLFHGATSCSYTHCRCSDRLADYAASEIISSWHPDGAHNEDIIAPGARVRGYPPLCDCEQCQALYEDAGRVGA